MTQRRGPAAGRASRRRVADPAATAAPARQGARRIDLERLRAVVSQVVAADGYDLEDLSISRVGRRHLLRIAIGRDAGVDLDAVAELSRRVSTALDAIEAGGEELIAGEYELEVGSPGIDRPLALPRHWRRNVGRLVQVRAGQRRVTGRVRAADDAGVVLEIDSVPTRFGYDDLGPGRVQVEFEHIDDSADADLDGAGASPASDGTDDEGVDEE